MTRDELKQAVIKWVKQELDGKPSFVVKDAVIKVLETIKKCRYEGDAEFQAEICFSDAAKRAQFIAFAKQYIEIVEAEAKAEYEAFVKAESNRPTLSDRYSDDCDYFESAEFHSEMAKYNRKNPVRR